MKVRNLVDMETPKQAGWHFRKIIDVEKLFPNTNLLSIKTNFLLWGHLYQEVIHVSNPPTSKSSMAKSNSIHKNTSK